MRRAWALALLCVMIGSSCTAGTDQATEGAMTVGCFCKELGAERKAEAQRNAGLPTSHWPLDMTAVEACIRTELHVDQNAAEAAFLRLRTNGLLKGENDGLKVCSSVGYKIDGTTAEPASAEVMDAARSIVCRMWAATPGKEESTEVMKKELTTRYAIPDSQADAALNRAAAEVMAPNSRYCPELR
jgi:hypothetical protein